MNAFYNLQLQKYQIINYLEESPKHLLPKPILLSNYEASQKNKGFALNNICKRYIKVND
jgi:hypothetical protein